MRSDDTSSAFHATPSFRAGAGTSDARGTGWTIERRYGDPGSLHAGWPWAGCSLIERRAAVCHVRSPALVIGSTQAIESVDLGRARACNVEVVRRKTGGGAVKVAPGRQVWLDAWVPRSDPLWRDDVVEAAAWLGHLWAGALAALGLGRAGDIEVHRGGLVRTKWSAVVCFAGIGPGEVVVGGRKVVGVAQRRNRYGAWFHSAAPTVWDPGEVTSLLNMTGSQRAEANEEMATMAVGLGDVLVKTNETRSCTGQPEEGQPESRVEVRSEGRAEGRPEPEQEREVARATENVLASMLGGT